MARPPITEEALVERYGPHLNQAPPGGWDAGLEIDRVVETHCCFCGQQCGIKLKVHDNEVVGFEPWYDFPFNEGKLCPKGVKRYLQGSHPDRLLHPMERDPSAPGGFREVSWDAALDRVVDEIRRIQAEHGDDAFAMLSGVSLTNEKSYLIGKFARLALHTANLDYNGRFCMVSAGVGNKKALGSTGRRTRGATSRWPTWSGSPARTWRRPSRSPPATSGGPGTAAPGSSSRTRGSCPWPAPPTCSCPSDRAATRPCSERCCTS